MGRGGAEIRHDGERARRAHAGRARGGGARDRLRDRRQGRTEREDRRRLSRGLAPADRLSVALTVNSTPEAAQYLAFLQSRMAKAMFDAHGFTFLVRPPS